MVAVGKFGTFCSDSGSILSPSVSVTSLDNHEAIGMVASIWLPFDFGIDKSQDARDLLTCR
jgi:hypothetical protein